MRELIIAMIATNVLLIGQILADRKMPNTDKVNKEICIQEMIPLEVIEESEVNDVSIH